MLYQQYQGRAASWWRLAIITRLVESMQFSFYQPGTLISLVFSH